MGQEPLEWFTSDEAGDEAPPFAGFEWDSGDSGDDDFDLSDLEERVDDVAEVDVAEVDVGSRRGTSAPAGRRPRARSSSVSRGGRGRARGRGRGRGTSAPPTLASKKPRKKTPRQPAVSGLFKWGDVDRFIPAEPQFDEVRHNAGISRSFPAANVTAGPRELFEAFFDREVVGLIVEETNKQAALREHLNPRTTVGHAAKWKPVVIAEFYIWLALTMLMVHLKKHVAKEYWLIKGITATPIFGIYMARDRYFAIMTNLHVVTNTNMRLPDPLWKIRPLYTLMRAKFTEYFQPYQKVVIDESLVLFRGNLSFRQYIPSKRHRFGIKFFVLCDCKTGYVLDFLVYGGKQGDIVKDPDTGFGGTVCTGMLKPYLNRNHILYTDNYYTSPHLTAELLKKNTHSVGTVRYNRKDFPRFPETKKGDHHRVATDDIMAMRWHDNRPVHMLSTIHTGAMVDTERIDRRTREYVQKPDIVLDYNKNMRLVDKSDMQVGFIDSLRKCTRWYKKFILHSMDMSILNAYNIYRTRYAQDARIYRSLRVFHLRLIEELLTHYSESDHDVHGPPPGGHGVQERVAHPGWVERHALVLTAFEEGSDTKHKRRRCAVCNTSDDQTRRNKNRRTTYECLACRVALCPPCWTIYHSKVRF